MNPTDNLTDPIDEAAEAADDSEHGAVLTLDKPAEDETDSDATDEAPSTPSRRRRLRRMSLVAAALAATAAPAMLSWSFYQHRHTEQLAQQAVSTTRGYLEAMAAFNYQDLDANRATITAGSTTEFAHKYDEMVKALRDIVVTSKGVATATASHVTVEHLGDSSAVVVGFVDQHVTNVTAPQGNSQKYRMVVTLIRSGDRWIVNDVETV